MLLLGSCYHAKVFDTVIQFPPLADGWGVQAVGVMCDARIGSAVCELAIAAKFGLVLFAKL